MTKFTIYSSETCSYCDQAKALIKNKGDEYEEILIGRDIKSLDFREKFPHFNTVPQIFLNDDHIGGFVNLQEFYRNTII